MHFSVLIHSNYIWRYTQRQEEEKEDGEKENDEEEEETEDGMCLDCRMLTTFLTT